MADAIATWLEIKAKLRRRMPAAEWDLAIRPVRLWKAVGNALIVALPANGRAIFKFEGYRPLVQQYARQAGYGGVCVTVDNGAIPFLDPEPPASRAQCPKCQADLALGAIFCQNCGKKLTYTTRRSRGPRIGGEARTSPKPSPEGVWHADARRVEAPA